MDAIGIDTVRGIIESRRNQYRHGIARTVTVHDLRGSGLARGVLEFSRDSKSAEVRDYGTIRFETRPLSVQATIDFFESLCRNETPRGYDFALDGTVDLGIPSWVPEGQVSSPIGGPTRIFPWPSLIFLLKPKQSKSVPLGPILRHDLPILGDVRDAVDQWCGFDGRILNDSHQSVTLLVPDFRARIRQIVLGQRTVHFSVESGILQARDLELRAAIFSGSKWSEPPARATSEGFEFDGNGIPQQVLAFLVNRGTDDVVDWANLHPSYGPLPEGVSFAIPEQQLAQTIAEGENVRVEFKQRVQDPFQFVQSVVAFANTVGGKIFVGVRDDGTIEGTEPERLRPKLEEWAERYCDPPIYLTYSVHTLDERPVLLVEVPQGPNRPYLVREKGTAYVRRGATDRPVQRAELDELSRRGAAKVIGPGQSW